MQSRKDYQQSKSQHTNQMSMEAQKERKGSELKGFLMILEY